MEVFLGDNRADNTNFFKKQGGLLLNRVVYALRYACIQPYLYGHRGLFRGLVNIRPRKRGIIH